MPPTLSGLQSLPLLHPFQSRQQYHLCAVRFRLVFLKMTQAKFQKLDELRQKDEKLFEMSLDLLFSIGFDNFQEEILNDALEEMNEGFELNKASIKEMELLVVKMLVLSLVSEIHAVPLETVLDYITENGWRSHEKSGC